MRIAITVLEGTFDSGLSALLDVFATASALSGRAFETVRLGFRDHVSTAHNAVHRTLRWDVAAKRKRFDHVIVPGFSCYDVDGVKARLGDADTRSLVGWLLRARARGSLVQAACTGTWVLAKTGMLNGHEATTSWWFENEFRCAFPEVRLDARQTVVRSGPFITAGAAFSHVDLALAVIRAESPKLAERVSNRLVTESRESQAIYLALSRGRASDPLVRKLETWASDRLCEPFDLERAAKALGTSPRTLQRKVQVVTGKSPLHLVQRIRLQKALALLRRDNDIGLDHVAEAVGYRSAHTLRMLIRRELAMGIRELRKGNF